jgi:hypothetical protein
MGVLRLNISKDIYLLNDLRQPPPPCGGGGGGVQGRLRHSACLLPMSLAPVQAVSRSQVLWPHERGQHTVRILLNVH